MIKNITNSDKVPFDLDGWSLIKDQNIELVYLKLLPGQQLEKHKNPFDVIFFVVSGNGTLSFENKELELNEHDSIYVDSSKDRGWRNEANTNLILLVVKIFG
jgi:quercetin dioxygenase-like cupin family protein